MKETIHAQDKSISVKIDHPAQSGKGYALSLHGGGLSTKETTDYLRACFTDRGFGAVSFDCSGWGESSGVRDECSLADRLDDAQAVIRHYGLRLDFLIGTSMGGYVATKLLAHVDVPNLILFCPAAYAVSAWHLPFGEGFTADIRRENSFLETDAAAICSGYRGNVLYLIGKQDEVIPAAVDHIYATSFVQANTFREVRIDNCPHPIHRWAAARPEGAAAIRSEISCFVDFHATNTTTSAHS